MRTCLWDWMRAEYINKMSPRMSKNCHEACTLKKETSASDDAVYFLRDRLRKVRTIAEKGKERKHLTWQLHSHPSWKRGGENKGGRGARRRRPGGCGHLNGSGRIYTPSAKQRVKRSHFCPCWMLGEGEQTTLHSSVLRSLFSSQPFWSTQQTFRTGPQSNGALTDLLHMLRGWNWLLMFSKTQSPPPPKASKRNNSLRGWNGCYNSV